MSRLIKNAAPSNVARHANASIGAFFCRNPSNNASPKDEPEEASVTSTRLKGLAVKDNIATAGVYTTCASGILNEYKSPYDASIVEWFDQTAPQKWYKSNMDEFGMGSNSQWSYFGAVNNDGKSPGGSSGGSAVLVADGITDVGIGTDTGGSVRLPAAYTKICGFKPSYGSVSRYGVVPYANSLDTVGLMTKDMAKMKQIYTEALMQRHDSRDPTSPSSSSRQRYGERLREFSERQSASSSGDKRLKKLRIGVPNEYHVEELTESVRHAWTAALKSLQSQGHIIVPISLPTTKSALSAYYVLAAAEAASNLSKYDGVRYGTRAPGGDKDGDVLYSKSRGDGFGAEVKRRILLGSYTLSSKAIKNHFIKAQQVRRLVQRDFDRVFAADNPLQEPYQFDLSDMDENTELESKLGPAQVDVIICPTATSLAPTIDEIEHQDLINSYCSDVFTVPASLAGLPALSVPVRIPSEPEDSIERAGLQVIGQYWDDQLVLDVGELMENPVN